MWDTYWLAVQQEAPQIPRVDELVGYFESTWISGQYRFRQWNYFDFEGPRTNNNVEGWHSRLKKVVGKPHPNLYEIIHVFKREEASTKVKLQILQAGAQQAPRRRKMRQKEHRIQNLFSRLNQGTMSIDEYLEAMKHNTVLRLCTFYVIFYYS